MHPPHIDNIHLLQQNFNELLENLHLDFNKQEKKLKKELKIRGIPEALALSLYLNDFIHKSKHYTSKDIKDDNFPFANLIEYFTYLKYAHCGQKPYALQMLLKEFSIPSRTLAYNDIFGWSHGFLQVEVDGKWKILDPTFNVYFDIGIEDIIENPYCYRKILSLYSDEFYCDKSENYENFIKTQIDENTHTTFKYCREWFMFMGFYPFVPPILEFYETKDKKRIDLYDIRKDTRYTFI